MKAFRKKRGQEERNMRKLFLSSFFIMAILLMFSCLGCAGLFSGKYGTILPNTNAAKAFESFQISADLNYYISGADEYPNALMGLNKKYTLDSAFWKKIDPSPQTFQGISFTDAVQVPSDWRIPVWLRYLR
jgi:hypothetical protein